MNFYIGNNAEAAGRFRIPSWIPDTRFDNPRRQSDFAKEHAESKLGRELKPSEVSSYWSSMAWEWIRENPGKAISLAGRKFYMLFSANEVGDQRQLHPDAAYSWVLRIPAPTFIVVVPLAVLGLALSLPRWRRFLTIDLFLVSQVAALVIIYTSARYRLPMMPAAMALAGFSAVWLVDAARARRWVPFGAAAWALALAALFTVRPSEVTVFSSNYFNLANKFRDMGKDEQAIELYRKAISMNRRHLASHNNLALLLAKRRETLEESIASWDEVRKLAEGMNDAARGHRCGRWRLRQLGLAGSLRHRAPPPPPSRHLHRLLPPHPAPELRVTLRGSNAAARRTPHQHLRRSMCPLGLHGRAGLRAPGADTARDVPAAQASRCNPGTGGET